MKTFKITTNAKWEETIQANNEEDALELYTGIAYENYEDDIEIEEI